MSTDAGGLTINPSADSAAGIWTAAAMQTVQATSDAVLRGTVTPVVAPGCGASLPIEHGEDNGRLS